MKNKILEKMNQKGFILNKMQQEAKKLAGENIVINAPTGSGKTEAILFNLKKGSYFYFLPTITSCIFMYNRLKELDVCSVKIKTSVLTEKFLSNNKNGNTYSITIMTPDPIMIGYLKGEKIKKGLILDELDNYPVMVKSALLDFIKTKPSNHIVVASATLDEQLKNCFKGFKNINYNVNMQLVKHKVAIVNNYSEIISIIRKNPDKKIGFIRNSISDMEDIEWELDRANIKYKKLHSNLTEIERLEAEKSLYEGDFKVFVSNDIISFSVDVDFEILFMDCSDKKNINLQRLGRNNRYNKKINYTNLYILDDNLGCDLRFIDDYEKRREIEKFKSLKMITYNKLSELKKELEFEELPSVDYIVNTYWKELKEQDLPLNLRQVPLNFKLKTTLERKSFNKKTKKIEYDEIETFKVFKINGEFPWSWYPYDKNYEKKYIHLKGQNYEILEREENGDYIIEEFYGRSYSEEYFDGELEEE